MNDSDRGELDPPDDGATFVVSDEVAHREVEGQILLLLPGASSLFTLNETGRIVWLALGEGRSAGEIAALVADRFGIPRSRSRRDVGELLAELEASDIIRRVPGSS